MHCSANKIFAVPTMSEKLSCNLLDVPLGVLLLLFLDFIPKQLIIATCKSM